MKYIDFINYLYKTNFNCVIHGFAGTGKSTLITQLSNLMGERCLKLAPTGHTAYHIYGSTLDSLLYCYEKAKPSVLSKLEQLYDCIVVEEISMVDAIKIDKLYEIRETLLKRGKRIKFIFIGDPFQLPPVATPNKLQVYSKKNKKAMTPEDFYFFESKRFQKDYFDNLECFFLTKNYRQSDGGFGKVLSNIATGSANQKDIDYINARVVEPDQQLNIDNTPIVVPQRSGVYNFNNFFLQNFDHKGFNNAYIENMTIGFNDIDTECRNITEPVVYAVNAPVVFSQNDVNGHWVNGTRGIITNRLWDYYGNTILEIRTNRNETVQCTPTKHILRRFIYNEEEDTVENECVAVIWQLPLILGFALTVHKSQGMTIDTMAFNSGEGLFSPGQLYVALSRVRKIEDLKLHVPVSKKDIIVSNRVREYFDDFYKRCTTVQFDDCGNALLLPSQSITDTGETFPMITA
jgi:hypothetical protein